MVSLLLVAVRANQQITIQILQFVYYSVEICVKTIHLIIHKLSSNVIREKEQFRKELLVCVQYIYIYRVCVPMRSSHRELATFCFGINRGIVLLTCTCINIITSWFCMKLGACYFYYYFPGGLR